MLYVALAYALRVSWRVSIAMKAGAVFAVGRDSTIGGQCIAIEHALTQPYVLCAVPGLVGGAVLAAMGWNQPLAGAAVCARSGRRVWRWQGSSALSGEHRYVRTGGEQ